MPRPRSVLLALLLLGASWLAGLAPEAWRLLVSPAHVDGEPPPLWASLFFVVVLVGLFGGLLAALLYRRRWAYIAYLALSALSLVSLPSSVGEVRHWTALRLAWYFAVLAVEVAATVLLLRRPAREWYGISRPPTPPGEWRGDPSGRHQHRYWDGSDWTEHVADEGVASIDPLDEPRGGVPLASASS